MPSRSLPVTRWLRALWRNLVRRRRADLEIDAEIDAHLQLLVDEHVRAGHTPDEARRLARLDLGGAVQVAEAVRERRSGAWIETLARDVRHGARVMARRPLATGTAAGALALGIGATVSVFSVVAGVLLRPLPYHEPHRLAVVLHNGTGPVSPANYLDWKAAMQSFSDMAAAEYWRTDYVGDGEAEKLFALRVTPNMFSVLGVAPELGRLFTSDTPTGGSSAEVILSQALWQRRFAGDPAIIGRAIRLDGASYTVIGVMPARFMFAPFWATRAELWAPLDLTDRATSRDGQSLRVFARLAPGIDLRQAQAEVAVVTRRLDEQFPGTNRDVAAVALVDRVTGDVRTSLWLILAAAGFVLLLTSANLAHVLLSHGAARSREFGMRIALGASRGRLVRQVLTETAMLVGCGGLAGLGLAFLGVDALKALSPPDLPRLDEVSVDTGVVAFAVAATALTAALTGLAPALRAARSALPATVRAAGPDGLGRRGRGLLVVAEFSLALVLAAGAGLTVQSFLRMQDVDPGFDAEGVLSMTVSVAGAPAGVPGRREAFYTAAVSAVAALPGVRSASAVNHLPIAGDLWGLPIRIEGREAPTPDTSRAATYRVVLPGYFQTMGIRLVAGRDVTGTDRLGAEPVVIVNEYFADRHWPGEDALGRRIAIGGSDEPAWMRIVGIARNTLRERWFEERQEEVYVPLLQSESHLSSPASHFAYTTLVVRFDGDAASVVPAIRDAIWRLDDEVPISDVQTMASVVNAATARPRFYMVLLSVFAAAALALAALGVYGVVSLDVASRQREFGIRLALGARPGSIARLVVARGLGLAASGTVMGVLGAVALAGVMASVTHGVSPTDRTTFLIAAASLAVVALVACWLPARRATRTDALVALRND